MSLIYHLINCKSVITYSYSQFMIDTDIIIKTKIEHYEILIS